MKLLKSLQEAIEETTSINNVDDQAFDKDAHGEAPVAYSDAVISMQKRHKEIRKQLKDHQDAAEKEFKISDADRINVETPKNDNLKKMHLSESLFEDFEEDGWPEELAEYEVLRKLEGLIYELNNAVRGANSGAKTFDELADYIDILAGNLSDMAHDIRSEYDEGELEEDFEEEKVEIEVEAPKEDSTPNPPTLEHMGVATLINSLIQDEWQAIQGYNDAVATLASEGISEDIIAVFKDIVDEENIHVGQLQKALETVSPNAESISKGEKEGEEQLQEPVTPEEASL